MEIIRPIPKEAYLTAIKGTKIWYLTSLVHKYIYTDNLVFILFMCELDAWKTQVKGIRHE